MEDSQKERAIDMVDQLKECKRSGNTPVRCSSSVAIPQLRLGRFQRAGDEGST
jgi:hypothetical protein